MMPVSDLIALLKAFSHLHCVANMPIHPGHAGTMAGLLDACEKEIIAMEGVQGRAPLRPAHAAEENVIHVKFTRPTPPEGGAA